MHGERQTHPQAERTSRSIQSLTAHWATPHLVVAVAVVVAVVFLGREVEGHISAMEAWLTAQGPWGFVAFTLLFVVGTCFLLPDSLFCIVAGALFGLGWGAAVVAVGALLGNLLQFALARRLLRARIQRFLTQKPALAAIQRAVLSDELRLQILLRLTPISPAVMSYMLGAAGVQFRSFLIASAALHPTLFVEVYFGHAGKHMVRMAGGSARTTLAEDLVLVGGLVVCAVVVFLVSRMARKAVAEAVAESERGALS